MGEKVRVYRLGHGEVNDFTSNSDWPEEWVYVSDSETYTTIYKTDIDGAYIVIPSSTTKFEKWQKQFRRMGSPEKITKQHIIDTTPSELMFYDEYYGDSFGENNIHFEVLSEKKLYAKDMRKIYKDFKDIIIAGFVR